MSMDEYHYDMIEDPSPEMLEVAAAGYEAMAADRTYMSAALRTSFPEAADKEAYRAAAENVFDEKAADWRRSNGMDE
jgi:hypothetical protein